MDGIDRGKRDDLGGGDCGGYLERSPTPMNYSMCGFWEVVPLLKIFIGKAMRRNRVP